MTTLTKLEQGRLRDPLMGWVVTLGITALAFVLRVINLGYPHKLLFDETYYAKDAYSLLTSGYERQWPEAKIGDAQILAGTPDVMLDSPGFIVHPPLAKWIIASGEYLFGMNPFGWRIMAAVFGSLLVLLTIRLARRLSRSTLVGAIAGLLLTFDGLAFVMSRLALLDIFQATFTVAAVACVVADRDWFRLRLARHLRRTDALDLDGAFGPLQLWRPWRLLAGVMFGAAIACKWNSLYVLAVFGLVSVVWDVNSRIMAGASKSAIKSVFIEAPIAFFYLVIVAGAVYLSTWTSWLLTSGGYDRDWGQRHPDSPLVKAVGAPLASLWQYHVDMYGWHTGDQIKAATHPYASHPASWILMIRPVGVDAVNDVAAGTNGCPPSATKCLQVITAMGTPLLWWLAAAALLVGLYYWVSGKDRRFAAPVLATLAVWLPWFQYADRPIFYFYAVVFVPFTVTVLAMVLGKILGPEDGPRRRRGAIIVGLVVALIILNFAFMYPVLTDEMLPHSSWLSRMFFGTWI